MTNTPKNVEVIFNTALEKQSEAEREVYLKQACGEDAGLYAQVKTLLEAHEHAGDFLNEAGTVRKDTDMEDFSEGAGTVIGRYKLLQEIGEGGSGVVYMAEQEEPVHRKVALKIIKLGMDTKQVIARFEAERQALAMMDHPNIAQVLDAGATETGRPYFVMELFNGIPITDYSNREKLSTEERLKLFIQVCNAVQHAHRKGIIHRDIKPSNVIVASHNDKPVPKVIDFGIAKATSQRLTEKTLFTRYEQIIGTPAYMSPEQAGLSKLVVDKRTDIYSLGVLLYELLTGTMPFERQRLLHEMLRIIQQVEPPLPSARLSLLGAHATSVASCRRTNPTALRKLLRGDLDRIVKKALEKDRKLRYETASDFAEDIRRHLQNEPVSATTPSASYRLRKLIKRNRVAFLAGSFVAGALILGFAFALAGYVSAERSKQAERSQRIIAQSALTEAKVQREEAQRQAKTAKDALTRVFDQLVRQKMSANAKTKFPNIDTKMQIGVELEAGREVEALAQITIQMVEDLDEARKQAKQTQRRAEEEAMEAKRQAKRAQTVLDFLTQDVLSVLSPEKISLKDRLDAAAKNIAEKFSEAPVIETTIRNVFAGLYLAIGECDAGYQQLEESVTRGRSTSEVNADHLQLVGFLLSASGDYWSAEACLRARLAICNQLCGNGLEYLAGCYRDLGLVLFVKKDFMAAEEIFCRALTLYRNSIGEEHKEVVEILSLLSVILLQQGKTTKAANIIRKEVAIRRKLQGEQHLEVARALNNLAGALMIKGDRIDAEKAMVEALAIRRQRLGDEHSEVIATQKNLEEIREVKAVMRWASWSKWTRWLGNYRLTGWEKEMTINWQSLNGRKLDEKDCPLPIPLYREALSVSHNVYGERDPKIAMVMREIAVRLCAEEEYLKAEQLLLESYKMLKDNPLSPKQEVMEEIVRLYQQWSKHDQAVKWHEKLEEATSQPTTMQRTMHTQNR